jgi:hemoglobin/transferrin/lactoferrin receptor protein
MPNQHQARAGLLLTAATAVALCAQPAAAQEQTGEGFFQMLGRIILGTGTAKVAIDTPQAVTALEQEDLDQLQPSMLSDLLKNIPGVQATGASARALGQAFNIRGIGNTEQNASEERIKVIVDGAPKFFEQYRLGSFFGDFELFKRVEVLRGPASSTLYGSGAIGGVVAFTTKDASDFLAEGETTALRFKSGYESNGDTNKYGVIFATRRGNAEFLAALNTSSGGIMQDGDGNDILGTEHESMSGLFKGKLTFGNDNDQTLTLALSRTDTDLEDAQVAQTGGSASAFFGTADIHAVDDTVTLTYNHEFVGNDLLDLTVQLSYTDTSVSKRNFSLGAMCSPGTFQVLCDSDFAYETTTLRVENTADLSTGVWENYLTFGVQVSEQERNATTSLGAMGFHPEGTDQKIGVYIQGEFTWNDRLTIIPGLRVDFGERTPSAEAAAAGATAANDTAVSPKLSALYELSDNWGIFGTFARTERMPTLDELYSYDPDEPPSLNLEKEEADSFELGFTFQKEGLLGADDTLQVKATAFHSDLSNLIARDSTAGTPYYRNIRAAEIWGAEIEASYDAERWFGSLAWSHVKSKDKDTGLTLADTPAENVALTVGAKFPAQNLIVGWRGYYFDDITTSSATTSGDHYDTHDLFITWSPEDGVLAGLDVNLSVENVFDKTYRNNLALDPSPGRNAKLSISKGFTW